MAFQASLDLGMPFFLNLMEVETLVVTYLKIFLLRKNSKCWVRLGNPGECQIIQMVEMIHNYTSSNSWFVGTIIC